MKKTTFNISKMDCSAEEQMVRMKSDGEGSAHIHGVSNFIANQRVGSCLRL